MHIHTYTHLHFLLEVLQDLLVRLQFSAADLLHRDHQPLPPAQPHLAKGTGADASVERQVRRVNLPRPLQLMQLVLDASGGRVK